MYNTDTRRGYLSNEASTIDHAHSAHIPKIFVICDRQDTAPIWGYILRQQGLIVILEHAIERAIDRWSTEMPDLVVIDVDIDKQDPMELYRNFRALSVAPILLFLPVHHETRILDAYADGVDEVVVKPISPPIFLAKIMAWVRRSWTMPADGLSLVKAGKHKLDPARRCIIDPNDLEIKLTNLEFRLLHLLMSRQGHIFLIDDLIETIWGGYGQGDQILLKNVVYRLRKKIEKDPSRPLLLQTHQGGYSFQG